MPVAIPASALFRGRGSVRRLRAKGEERKFFKYIEATGFEESNHGIQIGGNILCRLYVRVRFASGETLPYRIFMEFNSEASIFCDESGMSLRFDRLPRVKRFLWDYALNVAVPLLPRVASRIGQALRDRGMTDSQFLKQVYQTRKVSESKADA